MPSDTTNTGPSRWVQYFLILLIFLYVAAAFLPSMWRGVPPQIEVASQIVIPALFAVIHGGIVYRARGMLVFIAITFVIGNILENLGTRTGFPFGSYYFTDVMGPKLLGIPLLMGPAYLAIGYTSWIVAHMILSPWGQIRLRLLAVPVLAACVAVIWDLSADPNWSTLSHFWVWRHGGLYFGVPITNFFGWFLTNYAIFQLFALYLSRRSAASEVPHAHWKIALASYAAVITVSLGRSAALFSHAQISDAAGRQWTIGQIAMASAAVSLFLMGGFGALAFGKLVRQPGRVTGDSVPELTRKGAANRI